MKNEIEKNWFVPKFKFWDEIQKEFIVDIGILIIKNEFDLSEDRELIPVPSIGIKDQNGDDIYACDYVVIDDLIYRFEWAFMRCAWMPYYLADDEGTEWDCEYTIDEHINMDVTKGKLAMLDGYIIGNCFEHDIKDFITGEE